MNAISPARITIPGAYDLTSDAYHADPTDTPSLSAGMINDILTAPKLCWHNSRRLNPEWEDAADDKFTLGTVSHVLFLEPALFAAKVVVVDAPDWKKKDARDERDDIRAGGRTPILSKHMDQVRAARAAFMANSFTAKAFKHGRFEQSLFWRHRIYGFWCRARPDFVADTFAHLCDYKMTTSANPERFDRHAYTMGYHRRAAWYLDGAEAVYGRRPDHYWFCNQEAKAPHLTSVVGLDLQALEAGREDNDKAADLFAHCLKTGDWFGYRPTSDRTRDVAFQVGLPSWAYIQMDRRNA